MFLVLGGLPGEEPSLSLVSFDSLWQSRVFTYLSYTTRGAHPAASRAEGGAPQGVAVRPGGGGGGSGGGGSGGSVAAAGEEEADDPLKGLCCCGGTLIYIYMYIHVSIHIHRQTN